MARLTGKYGTDQPGVRIPGEVKGHWMAVPDQFGHPDEGAVRRASVSLRKQGRARRRGRCSRQRRAATRGRTTGPTTPTSRRPRRATRPASRSASGSARRRIRWTRAGAMFAAFGAELVDAKGNITVESDDVRQVLEYAQKLVKFLPADAVELRRRLEQPGADLRARAR